MMRRRTLKSGGGETLLRGGWLKAIPRYLDCGIVRGHLSLVKGIWLILIPTLLTTLLTNAFAIPLTYDDGGAESFWSDYYPNGIAVKFTPPSSRWKVTGILVYGFTIDKGGKSFIVEIRDSDLNVFFRTSLPITEYFKNATLHWARIPLPNVTIRGDFYVCVYPMLDFNGTQLWIAVDNDTISGNCFLIDCYRQGVRSFKEGQAMIKVEGEEVIDFIEIVPNSIFIDEDALKISFKIIAPCNSVEVGATLRVESLIEDCKVVCEKGLYETRIEWSRLSGLKEPAKLLLSIKAPNLTATLIIELDETLFSKHLESKEENERLRIMLNSSEVELRASRDKLEIEKNTTALLRVSLKEYQEMVSEKTRENERLAEELSIMRLLASSLAVSTVSLLIILLRWRTLGKPGGEGNA
jgi:hypothetical protein